MSGDIGALSMFRSKLFFLGNRDYIQGATVLRFALEMIRVELGLNYLEDIFVSRFKQVREADSNLAILSAAQEEPESSVRATLLIDVGGNLSNYKIIALEDPVTERRPELPYRQTGYHEYGENAARVKLPYAADFWDLLSEAVQLTKLFHLDKYNRDVKFRFMVGGFEQLRYFDPRKNEGFEIKSQIVRHMAYRNNIYNNTKITITSDEGEHSFLLPFIGKKV